MSTGPIYQYTLTVTCKTCGKESTYEILSVNPHKTHMQFEPYNPLTGYSGMGSTVKLLCGHTQDIEGAPLRPSIRTR